MALSTARMHKVRGRPPLLAAGISSLIHSHSSSVRSLGYVCSFIFPFYTTHEDFSDRLLDTTERSQVDQRVPQQRHAIVSLLDAFKTQQQPLNGSCTRTMRINIAGAPIDYYRTKKVSKRELS